MSEQLLEVHIETCYLWRLENINTENRLTFLVQFEHLVVGVIKMTKNPNNHNQISAGMYSFSETQYQPGSFKRSPNMYFARPPPSIPSEDFRDFFFSIFHANVVLLPSFPLHCTLPSSPLF
jgi:hypothetical protein